MKSVLILLYSLSAAVAVFLAGLAITAYAISDPEPHRFANLDTPDLWTSQPIAVDPSRQDYERIEALPTVAAVPASLATIGDFSVAEGNVEPSVPASDGKEIGARLDQASTSSVTPESEAPYGEDMRRPAIDPQHADWCFARYRSYSVEDDTYQPYGGGARRQCLSPWAAMPEGVEVSARVDGEGSLSQPDGFTDDQAALPVIENASASVADEASPVGAHEQWCLSRYRSYRVSDNSYQPFAGGARRICASPRF